MAGNGRRSGGRDGNGKDINVENRRAKKSRSTTYYRIGSVKILWATDQEINFQDLDRVKSTACKETGREGAP